MAMDATDMYEKGMGQAPAPWQERTVLLLGKEAVARMAASRVLVVGVGGVGGYAAEMLVRAGVGHLAIVDSDKVAESNVNRQLLALHSTIGLSKVAVLKDRLMDINPDLDLTVKETYLEEGNIASVLEGCRFDYAVDAIDTLSPKIALIRWCLGRRVPLVSSMGAGAKMDATMVRLADISGTRMCPLAQNLRKRLHKMGIFEGFQAVFSEEKPREGATVPEEGRNKRSNVGTISYLPAVFGCVCAQAVIDGIAGPAENC